MLCPACSCQFSDASASHCPSCGSQLNHTTPIPSPIVAGLVRPKLPISVDLAVTVDRTDSSSLFRDGIPKTLELVVRGIEKRVSDLRVFLFSHGDLDEGQNVVLHTDGGTSDQAIADARQIQYSGGGDPFEHHLDAIEHVLQRTPWNAQPGKSRSAILAFMTADTKPRRSGLSAIELGQQIQAQGISLYLVCEPTPTLYELLKSAGGLMFPISVNPDPADLELIAGQLAVSISQPMVAGTTLPLPQPGQQAAL